LSVQSREVIRKLLKIPGINITFFEAKMKIPKQKICIARNAKSTHNTKCQKPKKGLLALKPMGYGSKKKTKRRGKMALEAWPLLKAAVKQIQDDREKQSKKVDLRYTCSVAKNLYTGQAWRAKRVEFK